MSQCSGRLIDYDTAVVKNLLELNRGLPAPTESKKSLFANIDRIGDRAKLYGCAPACAKTIV